MIPQIKRQKEVSVSMPSDHIKMGAEEGSEKEYGLLDAVAEDIMRAIEQKDAKHLKYALESLVEHIQSIDEDQDHEMMGE